MEIKADDYIWKESSSSVMYMWMFIFFFFSKFDSKLFDYSR